MTAGESEALLENVRRIGPLVRENAARAERERRLSPAVVDALRGAGCVRQYVPRAFGGLEVDPVTCARVVEERGAERSRP